MYTLENTIIQKNDVNRAVRNTISKYPAPVFVIGSWQSGDFCHIYAAAVRHFATDPHIPFAILILVANEFGVGALLNDIAFAVGSLVNGVEHRRCTVFHNQQNPISKNSAIAIMQLAYAEKNARRPYDATFSAAEAVKKMKAGQPLTPVWANLVRGGSKIHFESYNAICMSFMDDYIKRFGHVEGQKKFVCLWARTSGMPIPITRPLGGANPQYDSSEEGNEQLCQFIKRFIPSIKTIFIVGDGFNQATKNLPYVFNLGAFWTRQNGIKGRFQENGFFDYMTAFYDCDVVHVGMKSGGMDTLALWGQKVVFIDSINSPEPTRKRVAAWSTENLLPVAIEEMPTAMGKAIELARKENPKSFKTTFSKPSHVQKMAQAVALQNNRFQEADLAKIANAVVTMFSR